MEAGDVIGERFELERRAGVGGMGEVFRARDRQTGEAVAVKVLRREDERDEEPVDRFSREWRLLAELRHPSIVRYVAHGVTSRGERYLAMDWLEGEDLAQRLDRGPLGVPETIRLARSVADGLAVAHARGVVHRDVKPSNVFLVGGRASTARLLDFGIARLGNVGATQTVAGLVLGTPGYMAPEQVRGEPVDARADVFSLGCVLFECITGTRAFRGTHKLAVLLKSVLEDAPRLREHAGDVPQALDDLVAQMLSKDAASRPVDAGVVLAALEDLWAPASVAGGAPAARAAITGGEQRIVSLVVASGAIDVATKQMTLVTNLDPTASTMSTMDPPAHPKARASVDEPGLGPEEIAAAHGARVEVLADGTLVATLTGRGDATDQAARAARCALALSASIAAHTPMALVTGRRDVTTRAPVGEAIERAARLIQVQLDARASAPPSVRAAPAAPTAPGARPGRAAEILLDDASAALLEGRFELARHEGRISLRGAHEGTAPTRTLLGRPTPCVGRERELTALCGLWDECVAEPVARAVVVTAPAGIGKSRLRHEALNRILAGTPDAQVWVGFGDTMRSGSPFALVGPALRGAAGVFKGEPIADARRKLVERVARHVRSADVRRVAEFLGELAGVAFDDTESAMLHAARHDPLAMATHTRAAWQTFLDAETRAAPVLLVLEDLHWGDLPSVRLVDEALRDLADRRFMVLALARPEVDDAFPGLWERREAQRITLGPLTRSSSEKLLRAALGEAAPAELVARVVAQAGGNAFFLEELARAIAQGNDATLPESILAIIQAHLDRLQPEARRVLRAASVFGEVFWRDGVMHLLGDAARRSGAADDTTDWLTELVQDEIVAKSDVARFPQREEYAFRHALLREGAYATLTEDDKRVAHRLAAAWLGAAGEDDPLVLAEHHRLGGESAEAVGWMCRAASQAFEATDFEGAIARAERAIAEGATGIDLGRLRLLEAEIYVWRGKHDQARTCLDGAAANLPVGGAPWCKMMAGQLAVCAHFGDMPGFAALVDELRGVALEPDARGAYVMPASYVVSYACVFGMNDVAEEFFARIVDGGVTSPTPGAPERLVRGWMLLAQRQRARFSGGSPGDCLSFGQACVDAAEEADDERNALLARAGLGHAVFRAGDAAGAEAMMRALLARVERVGLAYVDAYARIVLGLSLGARGAWDEAIREAERGTEAYWTSNQILGGFARVALALLRTASGDAAGGEREARQACERLVGSPPYRAHAFAALAEALLHQGRVAEASAAAAEAYAMIERLGAFEDGEALIRLVHVECLLRVGDEAAARSVATRAWRRILERASTLVDPEQRARFLEGVRENVRTRELARA